VTKSGGLRQFKALFSFFIVLVVFFGIAATIPIVQLKGAMRDIARENSMRDLELLGSLTFESMLRHDYSTIEEYLTHWGQRNPRVAKLQAIASNGFVIADYERETSSHHLVRVSKNIRQDDRTLATLVLSEDLTVFEEEVERVIRRNISALLLFTAAMGAVLWITLRRTAVIPMQKLVGQANALNLTLEKRVRERTADLVRSNEELEKEIGSRIKAESVLKSAKEELESQNLELRQLDQMKDALLRDVSHELKTPVAKHAMQMEILKPLLKDHSLTDEEQSAFYVMEESINRQMGVIRNLLDLARLEEGGRQYRREVFRIDELLETTTDDYAYSIENYGIAVTADVPNVTIQSDPEMMWHVFSNIISNAIKFRRRKGQATIDIVGSVQDNNIVIRVEDNGTGMTREVREKIFSRFYQASPSIEGSGVGLTICKRIVKDLGGSIRIDSPGVGLGTVIEVEMPLS
jgi:signal transduction histidine kinase